jgi:hypothetical protein
MNFYNRGGSKEMMKKKIVIASIVALAFIMGLTTSAFADKNTDAAKKWIDNEFQPSSLSKKRTDERNGMAHKGI